MTTVSRVARVCGRARRRASPAAPRVRAITHSSAENAHVKRRGAREHKRSVAVARRRTRATPNARVRAPKNARVKRRGAREHKRSVAVDENADARRAVRRSASVGTRRRSTTTARAMGDGDARASDGAMDDAVRGARARSVVRCVRDATTTTTTTTRRRRRRRRRRRETTRRDV